MAAKKKARRTTHRSSKGTKLYAKRDAQGRFKDIQTYKRAHAADIRRRAKDEEASQPVARVRKVLKEVTRDVESTVAKVKAAIEKAASSGTATVSKAAGKSPGKKKTAKKTAKKKAAKKKAAKKK
jgi:hypothetical protein